MAIKEQDRTVILSSKMYYKANAKTLIDWLTLISNQMDILNQRHGEKPSPFTLVADLKGAVDVQKLALAIIMAEHTGRDKLVSNSKRPWAKTNFKDELDKFKNNPNLLELGCSKRIKDKGVYVTKAYYLLPENGRINIYKVEETDPILTFCNNIRLHGMNAYVDEHGPGGWGTVQFNKSTLDSLVNSDKWSPCFVELKEMKTPPNNLELNVRASLAYLDDIYHSFLGDGIIPEDLKGFSQSKLISLLAAGHNSGLYNTLMAIRKHPNDWEDYLPKFQDRDVHKEFLYKVKDIYEWLVAHPDICASFWKEEYEAPQNKAQPRKLAAAR